MSNQIIRSDERKSIFGLEVNGPVFFTSALLIITSVALTLIFKEQADQSFTKIQNLIANNTGWFFVLATNIFVVFMLYIAFSKLGTMCIGGKKAKPEFSTTAWFSMLFSAGMGIGLFFGRLQNQSIISMPHRLERLVRQKRHAML